MKKIIILLLCCAVLANMVGCGGNTAPPSTERPPTTVSETVITEVPHVTVVELTEEEKEPIPIESKEQATKQIATSSITMQNSTEEIQHTETANISEENDTSQTIETTSSIALQNTESETTVTEPTQENIPESETTPPEFDIQYWISFAKEYVVSIGLVLDGTAVDCWDNPIRAGAHCIYLERDIKSRLNRYAKDDDITDVWIWAEPVGNDCYDIYIGYA